MPDGKDLTEIEVTRSGSDSPAVTVLRSSNRAHLDRQIRARRPPRSKGQRERVRVDILRRLHLNQHWIVLGTEGHERKCYVGESIVLEDVVEGLVNHRVRVTGHFERRKFVIEDIVAADPDDVETVEGIPIA